MNQILDKNYKFKGRISVEFSNDIAEIPYIETKKNLKSKKNNYKMQFLVSSFKPLLGGSTIIVSNETLISFKTS